MAARNRNRRRGKPAKDRKGATARPGNNRLAAVLDDAHRHYRQGDRATALALYQRAAGGMPGNARLHLAVASVALELARFEPARTALRRALVLEPGQAIAWINLSGLEIRRDIPGAAVEPARRALTLAPFEPVALNNRVKSLSTLGRSPSLDLASKRFAIAIPADPQAVMARVHWSIDGARPADAVHQSLRGLTVRPGDPVFLTNLGTALGRASEPAAARQAFHRALTVAPDYAPAWYNLGNLLERLDVDEEAITAHSRATTARHDNADYHFNRALCLLRAGRFEAGFQALKWRWRSKAQTTAWRDFGLPQWDGRPLNGRTVLIWAEQGLGDSLQFARYAGLVRERGGRAVMEVQPELKALFQRCPLLDAVTARDRDAPPAADFHIPMLSLPGLAGTGVGTCPPPTPLTEPSVPDAPSGSKGRLTVGLVWAGNPKHWRDAGRSIPLAALAPIAAVEGIALTVLQHGTARGQIAGCGFTDRLTVPPETADFREAATLIRKMDIVLTVDTAHAHLAGTLGVETWVLVQHLPDWRWLRERADSIWYPSVRLFRQEVEESWEATIEEVAKALALRAGPPACDQETENTAPN